MQPSPFDPTTRRNDFYVCRVLQDCALVKVASFGHLKEARRYMRRVATHTPNTYLVFSERSRRVLARVAKPKRQPQ